MKVVGWVLAAVIGVNVSVNTHDNVLALETTPTTPNKTASPLLITSFSFNGPNLRFVQIYNSSSNIMSTIGWQVRTITKDNTSFSRSISLPSGLIPPGKHIIAANPGIIDKPAFEFLPLNPTTAPLISSIVLQPPEILSYSDEALTTPTITASTLKEAAGGSTNYYVKRDVSSSTGNYLTGLTFFLPGERLKNDSLYVIPADPYLQVVEIYPDSMSCSPFDNSVLCDDYVKLYNASTQAVQLSQYRLRTGSRGQSATAGNTSSLSGVVESGHYVAVPIGLSSSGSTVWLEDAYGLTKYAMTATEYPSSSGHDRAAWSYSSDKDKWQWSLYPTPSDQPNDLGPTVNVNQCAGLAINEIAANVDAEDQFIEVRNSADVSIDVTGCLLQTNRSTTKHFEMPPGNIEPGALATIYVKDTELTLTKTTTGTVYLLSSDGLSKTDSQSYENLSPSTSWAKIDGVWKQTYDLTPEVQNVWQQYLPCEAGYERKLETGYCNKIQRTEVLASCGAGKYRSPDTNRCRMLGTVSSSLAACAANQARNPLTNRCKLTLTTTGSLKSCATNQYRNPVTNRCRLTIGSSSTLKACNTNQERNPETNRCRNVKSSVQADFPVEAVAQTGEATVGWWAFGGAGLMAAGYAGWEWRRELTQAIKRIPIFFASGK